MRKLFLSVFLMTLVMIGCEPGAPPDTQPAQDDRIALEPDASDPERLLRFYFGGYAGAEGQDPFEAGVLEAEDGSFYLNRNALAQRHPEAASALTGQTRLDDDALKAFWSETYYAARKMPPVLDSLRSMDTTTAWFSVEVDGVMTTARRQVHVPEAALRSALARYHDVGERLVYPVGTTIFGEHFLADTLLETTVMLKRADGFWDFATYDARGRLASETVPLPRALRSPTQCVGCHFGTRQFEPERSFPADAPPGPHGPRAVYVPEALRDADVTRFFDEHRKRSDTVLGLYATLYVSQLRAGRAAATITEADAALLENLGL